MSHLARSIAILALALLAAAGVAAALPGRAQAQAQPPQGYAAPATTGLSHLALMYHNPDRTTTDLASWVAQHSAGAPIANRWLFDSFLMLDLTAPSGRQADLGATNADDWKALLDRWFGTQGTARGGTIGQIDTAITTVAAARTTTGTTMGQPPSRRKIVVTIPWPSDQQSSFGTVDGKSRDLRTASDRDAVTAWHLDSIKSRFAGAGYRNVDLWGVYLMREDILPTDQQWAKNTTAAAKARGMKVAWIPYFMAPGWDKWRELGIDVAIMQPSYAFRSPIDAGPVTASRITHTAQLAASKGLGVEIESRTAASTDAEAAMFRQYLAEGVRLGFRNATSAYFIGAARLPAMRDDSYAMLGDYIRGADVAQADVAPAFTWTTSGTSRVAQATVTKRSDLNAIRVDANIATNGVWGGTVQVSLLTGSTWQPSGWANAGGAESADGGVQSIMVPLQFRADVTGIRVTFTPLAGSPALDVTRIVADPVWPTANPSMAVGSSYTVSAAPARRSTGGQYPDSSTATTTGFGKGKLNDGKWSTGGWWTAQPVAWRDLAPAKIVFDLGAVKAIDRVELRTHGGADGTVNWPLQPTVSIGKDCVVLANAGRGATPDCAAVTLPGSNPQITGTEGAFLTAFGGTVNFTPPSGTTGRYVTFTAQATGWFFADEMRFFSGGTEITNSVTYRLLTPPDLDLSTIDHLDNGIQLTDGNAAPIMNGHGAVAWKANVASDIVVDLGRARTVKNVTAWVIDDRSTGTLLPPNVTVSTSTNGSTWSTFGATTTTARTWLVSKSMTVTAAQARSARYLKITIAADAANPQAWHAVSEIEALSA